MLKQIGWIVLGVVFTVIGVIGLLLPIIPGVLFLAGALFCFAAPFPSMQARMDRSPMLRRLRGRWESARRLPSVDRLKLAFWSTLEMVTSPFRSKGPSR